MPCSLSCTGHVINYITVHCSHCRPVDSPSSSPVGPGSQQVQPEPGPLSSTETRAVVSCRMAWWRYVWWLASLAWAGRVPSTDRQCPRDMECRNKLLCPAYQDSLAQLKSLTNGSSEHTNLKKKLTDLICNRPARAVCCQKNYEVVGGTAITDVKEYPFLAYIHVRTRGGSLECGASLVNDQFLIGAKHCLPNFYERCVEPGQCFASFRKLNKVVNRPGEFTIDLLDVIYAPGLSDLALIKLEIPVSQHPDYTKGIPLQPVKLATEPPRVGETVYTAGWGRTGFSNETGRTKEKSDQLMGIQLVVEGFDDRYIYTKVRNEAGQITDTCDGVIPYVLFLILCIIVRRQRRGTPSSSRGPV